jgi:hypothetical protein
MNGYGVSTYEEIGAKMNLTRESVRQILNKALFKLRNKAKYRILDEYRCIREREASIRPVISNLKMKRPAMYQYDGDFE